MISKLTLLHWLLIFGFGVAIAICGGFIVRIVNSHKYPDQRKDRVRVSIYVSSIMLLIFLFVALIMGTLIWAETGVLSSLVLASPLLCLAPILFVFTGLGTYIQMSWGERFHKRRENLINKQTDDFKQE
jgi:sulfite exporter TauE/SafE